MSWLQSHFEERVYFLVLSTKEFLLLIWLISEGWKTELTLSQPVLLNLGPLDWESSTRLVNTGPLLHKGNEGKKNPPALEIIELSVRFYKHESLLRGCLYEISSWAKWNIFISVSGQSLITVYMIQPKLKLTGVFSLWSFWQKWNFILGDKILSKQYSKWNHMKGTSAHA